VEIDLVDHNNHGNPSLIHFRQNFLFVSSPDVRFRHQKSDVGPVKNLFRFFETECREFRGVVQSGRVKKQDRTQG